MTTAHMYPSRDDSDAHLGEVDTHDKDSAQPHDDNNTEDDDESISNNTNHIIVMDNDDNENNDDENAPA